MKIKATGCIVPVFLALCLSLPAQQIPVLETGSANPMPDQWIDRDTGHRIIHLTPREGDNRSFYFHNNPFIPAGPGGNDLMIFSGITKGDRQLFSVDLVTRKIRQLTRREGGVRGEIVGPESRRVYYQCGRHVFATQVDDLETRKIHSFPEGLKASITTLNADETLLGGAVSSPEEAELFRKYPDKSSYFNIIYEARLERSLFTLAVETGTYTPIYSERAWLNHVQFSPADPELMMYCHEGPWHKVDRIWTMHIRDRKPRLMHARTMPMEIAGHEFFSPDGTCIWFDLQQPRSETFYLASVDITSGDETRYALARDEWSIHFTAAPDQQRFAGDGGDPSQVARAEDGMWIYLFEPTEEKALQSHRLVNMARHDYRALEPNVHFSPDGRWVIFRATFEGLPDIYAVELIQAPPENRDD